MKNRKETTLSIQASEIDSVVQYNFKTSEIISSFVDPMLL